MTEQELEARIRASRNMPPANDDTAQPIEPPERAERIGLALLLACALPWLPLICWIFRNV